MSHKDAINKGMVIGLLTFLVLAVVGWLIIPNPETYSNKYWLKWCFLYSMPLSLGVLAIVLKRYRSEDLIRGDLSSNSGIEVERAYLQNTVEQTLIALPIVASFGTMASGNMLKIIPLHIFVFLVGRLLFWFGYRKSYAARIPGFVVTNYANIALALGCVYLAFNP